MTEHDADLELLALARLGLADRLGSAPAAVVSAAEREGLAALERHGVLKGHQVRAVRAYVTRHARPCACGQRVLTPEGDGATPCVGCGADVSASGGAAVRRPPGTIGPGTRVGPLEVLEKLGAGASGTVYRARHEALGRLSALKVIPRGTLDVRRRRRFEREVEALARLDHPGIVKVHAAYEHEGSLAFDMELVDGHTLDERLERDGPMPWRAAATLVADLARAVDHAHALGVVHRDLKPGNVLVRQDGRALLADLGLSRLTDQSSSLTLAGAPVGTPCYMAPEAFAGESTPQVDVYGLGAILYQALSGRPPFLAESLPALLHLVTRGQCEPTTAPGAPPDLEAVRACAMAVRPEARYPSAGALADDLERVLAGRATSASSAAPAIRAGVQRLPVAPLLVALALTALGAVAVLLAPAPPSPGAAVDAPPTTVDEALAALTRGAHQELALAVVERAAGGQATAQALDAAVAGAPRAPGLRLARALARRAARTPLEADDVAAVLSADVAAATLERLTAHAVARGLSGSPAERLAAARALAAALPASPAAATLQGLEACATGDPALREEALAALARGLPAEARAQRLAGAAALVERVGQRVERGEGVRDDARRLAQELRELRRDPRLTAAPALLLGPLGPIVREHLRRGPLGDLIVGEPRRSLLQLVDAAWPALPDQLLACLALLHDSDSELPEPLVTPERAARLEAAARAILGADPVVGAFALQLAQHQRLWELSPPFPDAATLDALAAHHEETRRLALAARHPDLTEAEQLWVARTGQRAATNLAKLEERRLALAATPEARRAHLERALDLSLEALRICEGTRVLFAAMRGVSEDVVRFALPLDRLDAVEAALPGLRHRDAMRAELTRRRGDPAEALRLAQSTVDALGTPEALGALALALVDLGRLDEARAVLGRLADAGSTFCEELSASAVARRLAAAEARR